MNNLSTVRQQGVRRVYFLLIALFSREAIAAAVADYFQRPIATIEKISQEVGVFNNDWCGNHLGQDIPASAGTPVVAIANGEVKYSVNVLGLGNAIHIEHTLGDGSKITSIYYHLKRRGNGGVPLKVGQEVTRGQTIGYITNLSKDYGTGPHLHLGIRLGPRKAGIDSRTKKWFYPGYTTIYSAGKRQCDQTDVGHAKITSEWNAEPIAFIDAHAVPVGQYDSQPSYIGNCAQRPQDSICIGFDDGYIWLVFDSSINSFSFGEPFQGKAVQIAHGDTADYYHVLGTDLVLRVPLSPV